MTFVHLCSFVADIDECRNDSLCSDRCLNTEGSYQCECFAGYALQLNRHDCEGWLHSIHIHYSYYTTIMYTANITHKLHIL